MIDPLTAASAAASLGAHAVGVLTYIATVQDAPARSRQMRMQLQTVVQLADNIERMLNKKAQMPIDFLLPTIDEFRSVLEKVSHRIRESSTSGVRRFMWPLNETETERLFCDIEHYKTSFMSFFLLHNVYDPPPPPPIIIMS